MNEDTFLDVDHTRVLQTSCPPLTAKELAKIFLLAVIAVPFAWLALACLMAL